MPRDGLTVLFGLSANPPTGHGGHAGLVRWAAERTRCPEAQGAPVDEVWVIPVDVHAFEDKRAMPSFEHRFQMARLAFLALPGLEGRVRVLDIERRLRKAHPDEVIGTIDVVRALIREHPERRFALLLGADTHRDLGLGRWKESEALLRLVPVIAVPRSGHRPPEDGPVDAPGLSSVSSTQVRASTDQAFLSRVLQPQVLAYMVTHGLYGFAEGGSI